LNMDNPTKEEAEYKRKVDQLIFELHLIALDLQKANMKSLGDQIKLVEFQISQMEKKLEG
jgi:hypothetical protein